MNLQERVRLEEEKQKSKGGKKISIPIKGFGLKNVTEFVERGKTKFIYVIRQLKPEYKIKGTEDKLQVGNFFKIGHSHKPKKRLSAIRNGNPYQLELIFEYETPQPKILEWLIQSHFHVLGYHCRAEWFMIPINIVETFFTEEVFNMFIKSLPALGYTEKHGGGRLLYDHRMFLEETKK